MYMNTKRLYKLVVILFVMIILTGATYSVFASWSDSVDVSPGPWGGSIDSGVGVVKTTNSASFSVKGIAEKNFLDPYAMLINSDGVSRSYYVPIRQEETHTSNSNTGIPKYEYYTRAKSNNLEPGSNPISYSFNPY